VVVLDKVHEKTLATDALDGLLKVLLIKCGPDLIPVIMSATLEAERFRITFVVLYC
jgi:HrpA-like RNA helicase